jgi:hypothetical protein
MKKKDFPREWKVFDVGLTITGYLFISSISIKVKNHTIF